ncbi:MAG: TolC family protein [Bacteroidota bacterium]
MKKKLKYIMSSLLLCSMFAYTQGKLEAYVEEGLLNNRQYLKERLGTDISNEEGKIAKSRFLPDFSFNASYTLADGGRTIDIPVGDLFNPAYATLNQLTNSNQFPTDLANVSEQLLPNDFHETKLRIVQPILNTDIYYGYKASKAQISVNQAREEAYKNELSFEIRKAYYDHLKLVEQKTILDSTRLIVKELVRVNGKFVKYGVATKDVLYNAEAQSYQIEAQLATVQKHIAVSRNFFNFLLNKDLESPIRIDTSLRQNNAKYNLLALQKSALANRSELESIKNGIAANKFEIKRNKGYLIPDVSAAAEFGYQGFGYDFDQNQDYYLISFNLSWPIFQGGRNKAKVHRAKLQKKQLETDYSEVENSILLEASKGYYEYEESLAVYGSQLSQLKSATENFKIIEAKYKQGQVLLVTFNEARTDLTTAQLNESIARFNIKIAKANLLRITQNNI